MEFPAEALAPRYAAPKSDRLEELAQIGLAADGTPSLNAFIVDASIQISKRERKLCRPFAVLFRSGTFRSEELAQIGLAADGTPSLNAFIVDASIQISKRERKLCRPFAVLFRSGTFPWY